MEMPGFSQTALAYRETAPTSTRRATYSGRQSHYTAVDSVASNNRTESSHRHESSGSAYPSAWFQDADYRPVTPSPESGCRS